MTLEKFSGVVLKYHTFKKKFRSCIEEVYQDFNVRMTFLEDSCVGKALEVIPGWSCFDDRDMPILLPVNVWIDDSETRES